MNRQRIFYPVLSMALALVWVAGARAEAPGPQQQRETFLQRLARELDGLPRHGTSPQGNLGADPLKTIGDGMTVIHQDLSRFQTDKPVQEKEKRTTKALDDLIAALEKHCSGGGNGGTAPGNGRRQSVIVSGDPSFGPLHAADQKAHQWNDLPPKRREAILQSQTEGFPPGFEGLLQSYYQRLSQEQAPEAKSAAPHPASSAESPAGGTAKP